MALSARSRHTDTVTAERLASRQILAMSALLIGGEFRKILTRLPKKLKATARLMHFNL
jgi:hypothetical protein